MPSMRTSKLERPSHVLEDTDTNVPTWHIHRHYLQAKLWFIHAKEYHTAACDSETQQKWMCLTHTHIKGNKDDFRGREINLAAWATERQW